MASGTITLRRGGMAALAMAVFMFVGGVSQAGPWGWIQCIYHDMDQGFRENNRWPRPYTTIDEQAVKGVFAQTIENGWERQHTLGHQHFHADTDQLSDLGRSRVRWILWTAPSQRRSVYVQRLIFPEKTAKRVEAVEAAIKELTPPEVKVHVGTTAYAPTERSAEQIEQLQRKYYESRPKPTLPADGEQGGY